jgi:acetyl/propionyl-CoA carboxylase alpha subunit
MFTISSQGKSAKEAIDEMLYNHAYCVENISITAIPVYYLEPNTRIFVHDENSQINGEYLVSKMTIPLTYNGTMSITATKAVERLY